VIRLKNGICCKCKAKDVYLIDLPSYEYGIPIRESTKLGLRYYICASCGYVESYVSNKKHLEKISLMGKYITPKTNRLKWD
jgi:hypothetical protein